MDKLLDNWVSRLSINLLGYSTIFIPGFFFIRYIKNSQYIDRAGSDWKSRIIIQCVHGSFFDKVVDDSAQTKPHRKEKSTYALFGELIFCFFGLQISYLTWGILQEKIMTKEYISPGGTKAHFHDSQFLVFVNRILAFALSALYIGIRKQPRHIAPLYKYSYSSFSNIMSSWCQYEALKYVSFPSQVLSKASKIIPTMIMGKIISGRKYEYYEYISALLISMGMTLFLLSSSEEHSKSTTVTTASGVVILMGYMAFDSFTANWQGELFSQYKMSSVQMMCGVNFFSCLLTCVSLLTQGAFNSSFSFMLLYPAFFWDCIVLSICSATGQLFIFYTISVFGPVIFIIIMTIRQGFAILLSCLIYSHPISMLGILGIITVFVALFLRIYCSYRQKQIQQSGRTSETAKV